MSKNLPLITAAALLAALGACNGGTDNAGDESRLDKAANMLDDNVFDTSPDDLSLNAADVDAGEAAPEPGEAAGNAQ